MTGIQYSNNLMPVKNFFAMELTIIITVALPASIAHSVAGLDVDEYLDGENFSFMESAMSLFSR